MQDTSPRESGNTKACNKCKIEKPATTEYFSKCAGFKDGLQYTCKECVQVYRIENKEEINASRRKHWKAHHEEHLSRDKQYRAEHKDETKQYHTQYIAEHQAARKKCVAKYNASHTENKKLYGKQYYDTHIEEKKQYAALYRAANSDKRALLEQKRRSAKNNLPSNYTTAEWDACKAYFGDRCAYCGQMTSLTQDHVVPISKGGGYISGNIIPACLRCNSSKQDKLISEWYSKQKYYAKKREKAIQNYLVTQNQNIRSEYGKYEVI